MRKEDEDIIFYAFRYALGRKTGVVLQMVGVLQKRWKQLNVNTRSHIQGEIQHAIATGRAGDECDIKEWERIIAL